MPADEKKKEKGSGSNIYLWAMNESRYDQRGVSPDKHEVHRAIRGLDKGLFPNAFCKILPDLAAADPDYCNVMHADTAGTKTSLAYLDWKESGNVSVFRGIAQDAIVMNIDDMACVGATGPIILSSTIGRNKNKITGEVIAEVIAGTTEFIERMQALGIEIVSAGGETADVGDIVRTIDVGYTAFARPARKNVQDIRIRAGNVIVGLASYGQASYEKTYNSGIASNGLTSARHDVLSSFYAENYPEAYDPEMPEGLAFCGSRRLNEEFEGHRIGDLLLSPTRTFLPVVKKVLERFPGRIDAILHNTGGAHSKVLKFCGKVRVVKDKLLPVPPVFRLIQEESGASSREMFQVFNMGTRLEFYVEESLAPELIEIARSFHIEARVIGHVESASSPEVMVEHGGEQIVYRP